MCAHTYCLIIINRYICNDACVRTQEKNKFPDKSDLKKIKL